MDGAELDVADAVLAEDLDLLDGVLRDLVGEGTEADHRDGSPACCISDGHVASGRVSQSYQPRRKPPASGGQSPRDALRYVCEGPEICP